MVKTRTTTPRTTIRDNHNPTGSELDPELDPNRTAHKSAHKSVTLGNESGKRTMPTDPDRLTAAVLALESERGSDAQANGAD